MSSEIEVRHVPALVRGRYLVRPPPDGVPEPTAILFGFHGYGSDAKAAMEALERIAEERPWVLVAPQALHPFYRRSDGSVVASWMTRLDRERAIVDNVGYVRRVVAEARAEASGTEARLAWVGFSQGVAMAYRAAARCGSASRALVALAGDVPPELRAADPEETAAVPPVLIGRGKEEEWYTEEKLEEDLEALDRLGVESEVCRFAGGHEWTEEFVVTARAFLDRHLDP